MNTPAAVRRVDPRRPAILTPQGLRRIVLGSTEGERGAARLQAAHDAPKAVRSPGPFSHAHLVVTHTERGAGGRELAAERDQRGPREVERGERDARLVAQRHHRGTEPAARRGNESADRRIGHGREVSPHAACPDARHERMNPTWQAASKAAHRRSSVPTQGDRCGCLST